MNMSFTDRYFWRTKSKFARTKISIERFLATVIVDVGNILRKIVIHISKFLHLSLTFSRLGENKLPIEDNWIYSSNSHLSTISCTDLEKPIVFVSACVDEIATGGAKYNGGIKELNYLVKLLRRHGYEAYMVTYDGQHEPWLIEHQPHISIQEFRQLSSKNENIRCVTSWVTAHSFIDDCRDLYFWDMELAHSATHQFSALARLYKNKIRGTAAISRTIQAWHMCNFEKSCTVIPNICDEAIWLPDDSKRRYNRVGYMSEGEHTEGYVKYVLDAAYANGMNLEFQMIKGSESEVLSLMQSCNIFLGLNLGKDSLWGEGCPRTIIESQAAGCIPIAFDVIGNREIILSGFNGIIVPGQRLDLMTAALLNLYKNDDAIKTLRSSTAALFTACHTMEARWPAVQDFLKLQVGA